MTQPGRLRSHRVDVPCTVDIAQTVESLHAHVELQGIDVGPGDSVQVHDAPTVVGYGEHLVCDRQATVTRATSRFELTLLYEVSFSPGRSSRVAPRRTQ